MIWDHLFFILLLEFILKLLQIVNLFNPIENLTLTDRICSELRRAIMIGEFRPGDGWIGERIETSTIKWHERALSSIKSKDSDGARHAIAADIQSAAEVYAEAIQEPNQSDQEERDVEKS